MDVVDVNGANPSRQAGSWGRIALGGLALGVFAALGTWRLESAPPLWWDEGWTLSVARNWVETGHYGHYLSGKPAASTLAAHFPVVVPYALSFRLFGVGVWQARMVGLVFTLAGLLLTYCLSRRLFNRAIAAGAVLILMFFPAQGYLHPLFLGRQVLGEMPSVTYLLAGYLCFSRATQRYILWLTLASFFWGMALQSKPQVMPFWTVSMLAPLVWYSFNRRWRMVGMALAGMAGAIAAFYLIDVTKSLILAGRRVPGEPLAGLTAVSALVQVPAVRIATARYALHYLAPALLGLLYAATVFALGRHGFLRSGKWRRLSSLRSFGNSEGLPILGRLESLPHFSGEVAGGNAETVRLMLLALAGSWMAWFILLSVGWPRYVFPALFMAAPFVSAMFYGLTGGFNFTATLKAPFAIRSGRQHLSRGMMAVCAVLVFALMGHRAQISFRDLAFGQHDRSVLDAAAYLNAATPPGALIETWESELLFLLNRPCHFPPPQLNVDYIRHHFLGDESEITYDLNAVNADFLVIGPFGKRHYESLVTEGIYHPVHTAGLYTIYERSRPWTAPCGDL